MNLKLSCLCLVFLSSACNAFSQEQPDNIRLFIDCQTSCDIDYIKTEIDYINYVNDRFQANVYILITSQDTGGGGRKYNLAINGQGPFSGQVDTLSYIRSSVATDAEDRAMAVEIISSGILPYILKTDKVQDLVISVKSGEDSEPVSVPENDPWNFWVMSIELEGSFEGENNYSSNDIRGGISASRITDKMKTDFFADASHETSRFGEANETFKFTNKSYDFDNITVWSLSPKLSAGSSISIERSDFQNYKLAASLMPAIEYNFFPYSRAQSQSITLMYRIGPQYFKYHEETIYLKTREMRFQEILSVQMRYNKPWGEISGATSFSHYLHDFSKNRLSFDANLDLRLLQGLFFTLGGSYSFQHDQLNIVKGAVTDEDLLTRRRELDSDFNFDLDFGIRYRFGSVFNNIVNPRFMD